MRSLTRLCLLLSIFTVALTQTSFATMLSDIPPEELGTQLSAPSLPMDYHFVDTQERQWDDTLKNIVREAFDEWDQWVCYGKSFFETEKNGVSLEFVDESKFSRPGGWLATYSESEIWINNNIPWYFDPTPKNHTDDSFQGKYDLLSVLKHEIGHVLGIKGDWGQENVWPRPPGPPSWTSKDEVMWGTYEPGEMKRELKQSDIRALRETGIHVVPEPGTFILVSFGFSTLVAAKSRRLRRMRS